MSSSLNKYLLALGFVLYFLNPAFSQPKPGDIFRDYVWVTTEDSGYSFLRVIGDGDYREPVNFQEVYPKECIENGWIIFDHDVDLNKAIKAELQVEFLLSHDETTGFAAKVNNNDWHYFKMPGAVPEPK